MTELSSADPTRPIDWVIPIRPQAVRKACAVYSLPWSELNGFPFNSDYAEACVKPRIRGFACAGGVR
jgi:hypothetical protein